ncbi:DUF3892 domain-containing protein [Burkholderia gladioli]|uniref:DUF3892 domain-containing protein n=1 Tax=Burkholderia gladioli TaxID=28095 RepID=UPI00163F89AF|nr:DUF3892 domain-containing protein [Burkholderia gladioli]
MANRAEIKCINKSNRTNPHERITHVGGFTDRQWKITSDDAIGYIERGEWSFFVSRGGRTVEVVVAVHNGRKYLKTVPDGVTPDNLLSLPECP